MPTYRQGGGYGGRGNFRLNWRSRQVKQALLDAGREVMEAKAQRILQRFQTEFHKDSGEMAREAFAEVEVQAAGRIRLTGGSRAPHTKYHELGTSQYGPHPQIREIMDQEIPTLIPELRANIRSKGGSR